MKRKLQIKILVRFSNIFVKRNSYICKRIYFLTIFTKNNYCNELYISIGLIFYNNVK